MEARLVVYAHAEHIGALWYAAVMLATRDMAMIERRADGHAVVVDILANGKAFFEAVSGVSGAATQLQDCGVVSTFL